MRRVLCALFFALALVVTTPALRAFDVTTSAITGVVRSANAPAAGVTVTVTSKALQHERTTTTNAHGRYWLGALPPGVYDVTFAKTGLVTLTRRTTVELARVARADATLTPGEEGESVTSTAATVSVADTHPITTHFSDLALDRLPVRRDPPSVEAIAPEPLPSFYSTVDDGLLYNATLIGEEAIEQVTVLRGALPIEYGRTTGSYVTALTRSGSENLFLSIRDTITSENWIGGSTGSGGLEHRFEVAASDHLLPERLWFFAAGWGGDRADVAIRDENGYELKLSGQLGARQNIVATVLHGEGNLGGGSRADEGQLSANYVAVPDPRLTIQTFVQRQILDGQGYDGAFAEASYVAGDHVVRGGVDAMRHASSTAWFAADRWSRDRFTIDAGVRDDDDDLSTRLFASYDFFGDGRRAVIASYRHDPTSQETTLGFATALGAAGSARIDAIHRDFDGVDANAVEFDMNYRLFDRIEAGANYAFADTDPAYPLFAPRNLAHAWLGAALPIGDQEIGVTVLERYGDLGVIAHAPLATDLALRYIVPIKSVHLTAAADVTNVFASRGPRAVRAWLRVRL